MKINKKIFPCSTVYQKWPVIAPLDFNTEKSHKDSVRFQHGRANNSTTEEPQSKPGIKQPAREPKTMPNKLDLLNFICANGGVVEVSRLRDQNFFVNQTSAKCFLESHPQFFLLEQLQDGNCEIRAHTTAAICDEYDAKKDDCLLPDCDKFHLCKHYVTGSCKFGTR